ncbi:MAG: rod-binding protein [Caulobacterales bacterium]
MSDLGFIATPADVLGQPAGLSAAELAKRGQINQTAQKFEASFLSTMISTMFEGVGAAAPFGGGAGEDMWKSFLAEAMAKQMAKAGGIGLSAAVAKEMLKMQGLTEKPS